LIDRIYDFLLIVTMSQSAVSILHRFRDLAYVTKILQFRLQLRNT